MNWQGSNWACRKFWWPKVFRRRVFGKTIWKPKFFPGPSVIMSHFSGLSYHVGHTKAGYGTKKETLGVWSSQPKLSCFFENFRPKALRKKFSKKCFHYLKFSGFSVLQKDAHHLNWKNISSKMYSSAFWFKFRDSSGLFLWIFCRKLSKKGFLITCRVFPVFYPVVWKTK